MEPLPHTKSCFVCGEANPLGLNLRFEAEGPVVRTQFVPRPEHAGFKGVVHGGILATVLDEIMVWACAANTKRFAFCAELNVRFVKPAHPGDELIVRAELVANRRDKLFEAKAEVKNQAGDLLASATGKYLPIKEADLAEMAPDLVDPLPWMRPKPAR